MQISLSAEQEQFIREQVESGRYQSPAAVVSSALDTLRLSEKWSAEDITDLRRDIQAGIAELDRGEAEPWNAQEIKEEGRRILDARRQRGD